MTGIRTEVLLDRSAAGSLADRSPVHLLWTLSAARWTGRVTLNPTAGEPVVVDVRDGEFGTLEQTASREQLLEVMGWDDGAYALDEEFDTGPHTSYGPPLDLLFEGVQAYGQVANLVQRVKGQLTLYPVPTQDTQWRLRALGHPEPLTELVQACDGSGRLATAMRHSHPDTGAKLKALFYAVETHLLYPSPQQIPGEVELVYTNLRGSQPDSPPEVDRRKVQKAQQPFIAEALSEQAAPSGEFAVLDDAVVLPPAPDTGNLELHRISASPRSSSSRSLARPTGIRKARRIKTQTELRVDRKQQAQEAEHAAQERAAAQAKPAASAPNDSVVPGISRPPRRPSRSSTPARPAHRPSRAMTPAPSRKRDDDRMKGDSVAAQRSHARGLKFMEAGDWSAALTEFSRAAQQHPGRLSYHGEVLWASYKNVPSKAEAILEKLESLYDAIADSNLDAERCRAEVQACIARILRDEGEIEQADAAYGVALGHDPTWGDLQSEFDSLHGDDDDGGGKKPGFLSRLVKRR